MQSKLLAEYLTWQYVKETGNKVHYDSSSRTLILNTQEMNNQMYELIMRGSSHYQMPAFSLMTHTQIKNQLI